MGYQGRLGDEGEGRLPLPLVDSLLEKGERKLGESPHNHGRPGVRRHRGDAPRRGGRAAGHWLGAWRQRCRS